MTVFLIFAVLIVAGLLGYFVYQASPEPPSFSADPEAELRAAVELHRIRRRLDAVWLKAQQRQDAEVVRQKIREALAEEDDRQ